MSGRNIPDLLARLDHGPVLAVGEHEPFTRPGVIVRTFPEHARLRFEVDVARANRAGLRIRSRVPGLASPLRESHAP